MIKFYFKFYTRFFYISKIIAIQFTKRSLAIILQCVSLILIVLRASFWNYGFPFLGNPMFFITGASVLSLTIAISNIMTSAFSSINSTINVFVAFNLGTSKFDLATINAKKMLGFKFICSLFLSLAIVLFVFGIAQSDYFIVGIKGKAIDLLKTIHNIVGTEANNIAKQAGEYYLLQLILTVVILSLFNPIWILLVTSLRIINSGGSKSNLVSITSLIFNSLHLIYLIILTYFVIPITPALRNSLPLTYFLFFSFDIVKMIIALIMLHKIKWQFNVNNECNDLVNKNKTISLNKKI